LKLTNGGDIACLPAIVAMEDPLDQSSVVYKKSNGEDVTARIKSADGLICHKDFSISALDDIDTKLIQPGESYSVFVSVDMTSNSVENISFEAFWNPQDPTGIIRDKKVVNIQSLGISDFVNPDDVKVYPNPVSFGQEITIFTKSKPISAIQLCDLTGKTVWIENYNNPMNEIIKVSHLLSNHMISTNYKLSSYAIY